MCPIVNAGGASLEFVRKMPHAFIAYAVAVLTSEAFFTAEAMGGEHPLSPPGADEPIDARWEEHLRGLLAAGVLGSHPMDGDLSAFYGGYFAVMKDREESRAIFPCPVFDKACAPHPLLPIASQTDVIRVLVQTPKPFFVVADFKNWFYQMAIPGFLARCLRICCSAFPGLVLFLRVLPMGWSWSCNLAQAWAWAVVLFMESGEDDLGIDHAVIRNCVTPPKSVLLRSGGCIMLIYDTVLVVAMSDKEAIDWRERIERNCGLAKVILKYLSIPNDVTPSGFTCMTQPGKLVFDGVHIKVDRNGPSWQLDPETATAWNSFAAARARWTPRTLWRALGFLRFAFSIQGRPVRLIGRAVRVQVEVASQIPVVWDTERADLQGPIELLQRIIISLGNPWRHAKSHLVGYKRPREGASVGFLCVDATPRAWAFAQIDVCEARIVGAPHRDSFACETPIDIAEASVMRKGIEFAQAKKEIRVWFVAGDNTAASRAFLKGYSPSGMDAEIVASGVCEWDGELIIVDIPTDENYADIDSRPDEKSSPENERYRRHATWRRLQSAMEAWKKWPAAYFGRSSFEYDENEQSIMEESAYMPDATDP